MNVRVLKNAMRCGQGNLGSLELFELRPRLLAPLVADAGRIERDAPETSTANVEALVRAKREVHSQHTYMSTMTIGRQDK